MVVADKYNCLPQIRLPTKSLLRESLSCLEGERTEAKRKEAQRSSYFRGLALAIMASYVLDDNESFRKACKAFILGTPLDDSLVELDPAEMPGGLLVPA